MAFPLDVNDQVNRQHAQGLGRLPDAASSRLACSWLFLVVPAIDR